MTDGCSFFLIFVIVLYKSANPIVRLIMNMGDKSKEIQPLDKYDERDNEKKIETTNIVNNAAKM